MGIPFRCSDSDCIATAKLMGNNNAPVRTFDFADGHWTLTTELPKGTNCTPHRQKIDAALWVMWSVQAWPDGTMTGTITNVGADACHYFKKLAVALTRIGDAPG